MKQKMISTMVGVLLLTACGYLSDPIEQIIDAIYQGGFAREENKNLREAVQILTGKTAKQLTEECTRGTLDGYSEFAIKLILFYVKNTLEPGKMKQPKGWSREYNMIAQSAVDNIFLCMNREILDRSRIVTVFQE